jgi:hypothetical protein
VELFDTLWIFDLVKLNIIDIVMMFRILIDFVVPPSEVVVNEVLGYDTFCDLIYAH